MSAAFHLDELLDKQLAALEGAKRFKLAVLEQLREELVAALKFFESTMMGHWIQVVGIARLA